MKKYCWFCVEAVVIVMLLTGCSGVTFAPGSSVVFTAGYYTDHNLGKTVPCLWTLTMRTDLPIPGNSGEANSVFYYQDNFHAAGSFYNGSKRVPCYWISKNQLGSPVLQWIRIDLESGAGDGRATSICVSDSTVYIAGYHDGSPDDGKPCYWTIPSLGTGKPTRTELPGGTLGKANSVYTVGGTVYTAGYYYNQIQFIPCYWTGTSKTDLDLEGKANSICVSGNSIYIAGYCSKLSVACNNTYRTVACYWTIAGGGSGKPSRTVLFEDCSETAEAKSIYVSGGTVYTAGYYTSGPIGLPCYWTNTNKTLLESVNGQATGIYVNGNTVYTSGYLFDLSIRTPCYWRDGTRIGIDIPGGVGFDGQAHSILGIP